MAYYSERDTRDYGRPSFRGRGPKNYQRSDERIREDVCERLTYDERVDASDLEVEVRQGVVRLSGTVDDRWSKRMAEDIAETVFGVRDVENQIRVRRESR
jgi:osmotically-inducible protein OsmY